MTISSVSRPTPGAKSTSRETSVKPSLLSTAIEAALCDATRAKSGRSGSREMSSRSASVATPRPHAWRAIQ